VFQETVDLLVEFDENNKFAEPTSCATTSSSRLDGAFPSSKEIASIIETSFERTTAGRNVPQDDPCDGLRPSDDLGSELQSARGRERKIEAEFKTLTKERSEAQQGSSGLTINTMRYVESRMGKPELKLRP